MFVSQFYQIVHEDVKKLECERVIDDSNCITQNMEIFPNFMTIKAFLWSNFQRFALKPIFQIFVHYFDSVPNSGTGKKKLNNEEKSKNIEKAVNQWNW